MEHKDLIISMIRSWVDNGQLEKLDDHDIPDHFCSLFDPLIGSDISARSDMRSLIQAVESYAIANKEWDDGEWDDYFDFQDHLSEHEDDINYRFNKVVF